MGDLDHLLVKLDDDGLNLIRERDYSDSIRPVDNVTLVVGGNAKTGRVDFITRWQPHHYCSRHRHLSDTISIVLSGEHWIEHDDGSKTRRPPGHYSCAKAGETHREFAGPEGSIVFFSMQSDHDGAFQTFDEDDNPRPGSSIAQMLSRLGPI